MTNASNSQSITSTADDVHSLAFDWVHRNLYWTDSSTNTIEVMTSSSDPGRRWRRTLISGLDRPRGVVVDPRENYRYAIEIRVTLEVKHFIIWMGDTFLLRT